MKKYLFIGGIIGAMVMVGLLAYQQTQTLAGEITDTAYYCDTSATTSVNLIGVAAVQGYTTSVDCTVPVKDWKTMTLYTQMNASTTGSTLSAKAYGSYDGIDWFDIPNITVDSTIANTVGSTTAAFSFAPQTSGFNRTTWQLDPRGFRVIKWTTTAGTASSSVWQMAVPTSDI